MAEYVIPMPATISRREIPFFEYTIVVTGDDIVRFKPVDNFEVPVVYSLLSCNVNLVTDATVANRRLVISQTLSSLQTVSRLRGAAVTASSSIIHQVLGFAGFGGSMAPYGGQWAGLTHIDAMTTGSPGYFTILVEDGVAGDTVTIKAFFKYRNWDLGMEMPQILSRTPDVYERVKG